MENKECLKDTRFKTLIDKDVLDILGEIDNTIINEGLIIEPVEGEDEKEPEHKCRGDHKCGKHCKCHGDKYVVNVNINDNEIDPKVKGADLDVEVEGKEVCPECGKEPCECKESLKDDKFRQVIDKDVLDILGEINKEIANEAK